MVIENEYIDEFGYSGFDKKGYDPHTDEYVSKKTQCTKTGEFYIGNISQRDHFKEFLNYIERPITELSTKEIQNIVLIARLHIIEKDPFYRGKMDLYLERQLELYLNLEKDVFIKPEVDF